MATLPYEVTYLIATYFIDSLISSNTERPHRKQRSPKLNQCTVISRQWQAIVERMIWRRIRVDSVQRLQQFTSGDPYRRARVGYIQHIHWWVGCWRDLPVKAQIHGNHDDNEIYAQALQDWYQRSFLSCLRSMLQVLGSWEDRADGISLSLGFSQDLYVGSPPEKEITPDEKASMSLYQLCRLSQVPCLLDLTGRDLQDMSMVSSVGAFELYDHERAMLQPSAFFHILSHFPCAKHVVFGESWVIPQDALQALFSQRKEVTDHLALVPRSVEKVTYSTSNRELSLSPVYNAANYCSRNGLDGFSVTFRTPSMQFREVHLEGVRVSSALLWPGPEEGDVDKTAAALYWPNLEVMEILDIPPYTANGGWILDNDPRSTWETDFYADDSLSEDWDYDLYHYGTRRLIKSHVIDKLYEAVGCAVHRMPRLHKFKHSFRGADSDCGSFEYLDFKRDFVTGQTRLEISSEWEYKMGEGVVSAWGLKGETADEFREKGCVSMDQWPMAEL